MIRRFFRRPPADRLLLLYALGCRLAAAVLIRCVPFGSVLRRVFMSASALSSESDARFGVENETERALRVAWAVQAVSAILPSGKSCLPDALATCWLLKRHGCSGTLQIGILPREDGRSLAGHAWVEHGGRIIVGGPGPLAYLPQRHADARLAS